jgi:glycosyltransferase involved in cell wall biosynthesis
VHSGVVGWPYPIGWVASSIALLRRKTLVIVVESAPWRLIGRERVGWKRQLRAVVTETLARWFVNRAAITFFTQPGYRQTLLTAGIGPGFIVPASWIDEQDVKSRSAAIAAWQVKRRQGDCARFLFAGRLAREKGMEVLLASVDILRRQGVQAQIDIIGSGPLHARCLESERAGGSLRIRVLDPVPYGAGFFALLGGYHAVVVPSLSDEQPRIVFDAYSQAIPVIAADTDGLRPHVLPGRTGWRVACGDPAALADVIAEAAASGAALERMGLLALELAATMTHEKMHAMRWQCLLDHCAP